MALTVAGGVFLSIVEAPAQALNLNRLGTYSTGLFNQTAAEISAYDALSQRLFVTNGATNSLDILNISNPQAPTLFNSISLNPYGGAVNSVSVKNGLVAVAVAATPKTNNGRVAFFSNNGTPLNSVTVGALPDMLTFTPDGTKVLVANEGEPEPISTNPVTNPEGSISIIDLANGVGLATVTNVGFTGFNSEKAALKTAGVRLLGNANSGPTVAEDVEPEYITVSADGAKAWISLQENNALAVLDVNTATITEILPLGWKNHNLPGNQLDASDRDNAINIRNWPVFGMYMPDTVASYSVNGQTYILTANEGDDRNNDVARVRTLTLDPTAFPNGNTLRQDANLGRLTVSTVDGDTDGDGDYDQLYSLGARSFSIRDSQGNLVFDSGNVFENITASTFPAFFNTDADTNSFDSRSDNKGPEPEGLALGQIGDRFYAFIGLERIGGFMTYDITNPTAPFFVSYNNSRNFSQTPGPGTGGDISPEGVLFISSQDSPNGQALVVLANEVSGTTTIYAATTPEPNAILGLFLLVGWGYRRKLR